MKKELFFKDNKDELKYLFCHKKKQFVLFLGSGVNGAYPNLSWNSMLENLLKTALSILCVAENLNSSNKEEVINILQENKSSTFNTYYKASIIKKVLGNQYISFLQNHLYSNCNRRVIQNSIKENNWHTNILLEVAELILKCDNIKAVVTYNYDNFLSISLNLLNQYGNQRYYRKDIEPVDLYQTILEQSLDDKKFPIYHVHGFIPPPDQPQISEAENIVLAYDEYFNNIMESFSWQTTTQLHFLNNYNILFIGASLDDWNMLRALSVSKKYSDAVNRFAIFRNEYFDKNPHQATFLNRLKASVLEDVGIKSVYTETMDQNDFSEITKLITELKETYDRKDK
jgi:hypothetical protein